MLYYNTILLNHFFLILDTERSDECIDFIITCIFVCVYVSSPFGPIKMLQFPTFSTYGSFKKILFN